MKCYIILNGEGLKNIDIKPNSYIIATDGAVRYCESKNIEPNLVVGDFDSLGYVCKNAKVFPRDKNLTDGEIALRQAYNQGFKEVEFLCGGGGRDDHFICNLRLLEIAYNEGIFASLITNYSQIYYIEKSLSLEVDKSSYISILPICNSIIESSSGLKYEYSNTILNRASTLGISNVATNGKISLKIKQGSVYLFVNFEKYV